MGSLYDSYGYSAHITSIYRSYACAHHPDEYVAKARSPTTRGRRKARLLRRSTRTPTNNQSDDVSKLLEKVNYLEKQLASMARAGRHTEVAKSAESE